VRVYIRQVFDGNPMPCRKKRVNDYGAAPEAAQWNGSMDELPVASFVNRRRRTRSIIYVATYGVSEFAHFLSDHRFFNKFELHFFLAKVSSDQIVLFRFFFIILTINLSRLTNERS